MTIHSTQAAAAGLACTGAFVGGWAQLAPRSFYDRFPLPGHHWIAHSGAFNEHLIRDVGGMYLALTVLSVWAMLPSSTEINRITGAAWSAFNIPHLIFHGRHLDEFGPADQIGTLVTLGAVTALGLVLLAPGPRPRNNHSESSSHHDPPLHDGPVLEPAAISEQNGDVR